MPEPKDGETRKEYLARCIPQLIDEGKEQDQAAAICNEMWRDKKAIDPDALVYHGDTVKALGNGTVGGYLVRFTSEDDPDLEDEFFTSKTDFGSAQHSDTYYNHGLDGTIGKRLLTVSALKMDDVGIWVEGQLKLRDEWEQAIYAMAEKGKLGWSSGTAPHLVEKKQVGAAYEITRWPLGLDASLTPTPAEPRNMAMPLKSWAEMTISDASLEVVTQETVLETASVSTTAGDTVVVTVSHQKAMEKPTTMEDTTMSEKVETTQEAPKETNISAPAVDVEAIASEAVKAFWESLQEEDETPVKNAGYRVTRVSDEADRALAGNPFKSFGEMSMLVKAAGQHRGETDKRLLPLQTPDGFQIPAPFVKSSLKAVSGMSEGVPASAGFLVGTDSRLAVIERDWAVGALLSRVSMFPVSAQSNGMTFNFENETSRAAGSRRGGVLGYWAAEAADKTKSMPAFRQVSLRLKKAVALVYCTDELLADATALESYLNRVYPEELMFLVEDSIINGTGVGMPLGVIPSGAEYSVPKETGQAADTVVAQNVIKMWTHRYIGASDYVWLINQEVEAQLMQMALGVGTGGLPVYLPPGGLSVAPYGTIFGRPVLPVEYCSAVGTVGDIILMAPSQYYMINKGGVESASSVHYRFINDETVFRFVYRVDGQPSWNSPLTPFKGTASSISPFVTLASRD